MKPKKQTPPELAQAKILAAIDEAVNSLGREDYEEVLDWLGSEVKCRMDCLRDEKRDEGLD